MRRIEPHFPRSCLAGIGTRPSNASAGCRTFRSDRHDHNLYNHYAIATDGILAAAQEISPGKALRHLDFVSRSGDLQWTCAVNTGIRSPRSGGVLENHLCNNTVASTPNASASRSMVSSVGAFAPFSSVLMYARLMPATRAKSSCEMPLALRIARRFAANVDLRVTMLEPAYQSSASQPQCSTARRRMSNSDYMRWRN